MFYEKKMTVKTFIITLTYFVWNPGTVQNLRERKKSAGKHAIFGGQSSKICKEIWPFMSKMLPFMSKMRPFVH